ncbi:MAG: hypothetical protein H6755_05940 [Candidatus Omnitrophica bacterium]|nr:hypothetical protein [Candidatus Omnitrophota bacterium]MCB9747935.1 hypothetical protein [Candidatus Omnitrophota bacterium]
MSELAFNRIILEKAVRILSRIVIGLLILNLLQVIVLIKFTRKPVLLLKETQTKEIEMLDFSNYEITETILNNFVRWIASEYLSFGPDSLPNQIESITNYLNAEPKSAILKSYEKNKAAISSGVYFQFNLKEIEVTKRSNPYTVEATGEMSIIDKNGRYKKEDRIYEFDVLKVKSTSDNPYGLKVISITEKKVDEGGEA